MSNLKSASNADQIAANYSVADEEFKRAVQDRVDTALEEAGLLDEDGNPDVDLIIERAYEELKTKVVVNIESGNDDRFDPKKSSSKQELASAVFKGGLRAADVEGNVVEKKAYERCLAMVWNYTSSSGRGRIQKRFAADKLLLVRGNVYRNGNTIDSGVFVTTNPELVLREYLGPRLEAFRKLTEAMEGDFNLALERDKELEGPLRAAIEDSLTEATAKLPVSPLLKSGSSNGKKALGK